MATASIPTKTMPIKPAMSFNTIFMWTSRLHAESGKFLPRLFYRLLDPRRGRPADMIPGLYRTRRLQAGKDIGVYTVAETAQFFQFETGEVLPMPDSVLHRGPDDGMGIPEGQALFCQIIGKIGRRGIALRGGLAHRLRLHRDRGDQPGIGRKRCLHGIQGIEEDLLVL